MSRRSGRYEYNSGFTLIELAVVVMIIGLLAAILVPQYVKQTDKAKDNVTKTELKNMQNAVELYYVENGQYPDSKTELKQAFEDYGISWPVDDPYGGEYAYYYKSSDSTVYYIVSEGSEKTGDGTTLYCSQSVEPTRGEPEIASYTKIPTEGSDN